MQENTVLSSNVAGFIHTGSCLVPRGLVYVSVIPTRSRINVILPFKLKAVRCAEEGSKEAGASKVSNDYVTMEKDQGTRPTVQPFFKDGNSIFILYISGPFLYG